MLLISLEKGSDMTASNSRLVILFGDVWVQAMPTNRGTIGRTTHSVWTVRSFDPMALRKHVLGRQRKLDAQGNNGDCKGLSSSSRPQSVERYRAWRTSDTALDVLQMRVGSLGIIATDMYYHRRPASEHEKAIGPEWRNDATSEKGRSARK